MQLTLATAIISAPALVLAGNFYASCPQNNLQYSTMNSKCNGVWTSIDLNTGIGTQNGKLVWMPDGNYFARCDSCSLDASTMTCQVRDDNNDLNPSTIGLDDKLSYIDGKLVWDQ